MGDTRTFHMHVVFVYETDSTIIKFRMPDIIRRINSRDDTNITKIKSILLILMPVSIYM